LIPSTWRDLAIAPPRAWGEPVARGTLRAAPEDFLVEEQLGFAPSGAGSHVLLRVRKRDANTEWIARELARLAGCAPRDVGFAGLKDRRAVATQWFTVPAKDRAAGEWSGVHGDQFEVLEAHAHARKLPRGALAGNRFTIRVVQLEADAGTLAERLEIIRLQGVPNYFGPQRFGRDLGNLGVLLQRAAPEMPTQRAGHRPGGFELSAARSLVFNAILAERVRDRSWNALCAGDLAMLDGRGSFFAVVEPDATLTARARALEIHPTGAMWGRGTPATKGAVLARELDVAQRFPAACELVERAGMEQERRSLRLAVRGLEWRHEAHALELSFELTRGAFATAVLGEILAPESVSLAPA
jgi:tRNA pseudouridine13 synthase